jgi:hypothetical protein
VVVFKTAFSQKTQSLIGQENFSKSRQFSFSIGYTECGRVPNFYAESDDKIIFAKSIEQKEDFSV